MTGRSVSQQISAWLEAHPGVDVGLLAVAIGSSWMLTGVYYSGEPISVAAREGLVAGTSALIVGGVIEVVRAYR